MTTPTTIDQIYQGLQDVKEFAEDTVPKLEGSVGELHERMERVSGDVERMLAGLKEMQRVEVLKSRDAPAMVRYEAQGGEERWIDPVDLKLLTACFMSAWEKRESGRLPKEVLESLPRWKENLDSARRDMDSIVKTKALDSTTSGAGDELVPTAELPEMWMDINLQTAVKTLFRNINMPTNPFDVPLQLGDVNWYRGTANQSATSTDLATAKRTLTASEIVANVAWAYDLDEDAVVAMLPEIRATLVRNAAEVMDDMILNGDTTDTGTNINADGAASGGVSGTAGLDQYLAFDGLVHIPLVDNTGQGNDHSAAVSDDMFNEIRSKLDKYGVRPSQLAYICDLNTYIRSQSVSNFRTLDKLGPQATVLTGQLGQVEGIPVIVSEQLALADTDGKVTSGGNGTDTGRLLIVNREQYWVGSRRELLIEVDRDVQKRQTVMVVSFRMAFEGRNANASDNAVAMQYNITGVS